MIPAAGAAYLMAFGVLFALRVGREERMMLKEFGPEYRAYMDRTKRYWQTPEPGAQRASPSPVGSRPQAG